MEEENTSWINIADVMSALMMIFMFIAIAFMYRLQNEKEIYKVSLNKELHKEFDKDLKEWKAEITDDNILRFNSPFRAGSSKIPYNFKIILNEFFLRYITLLTKDKFINEIYEIRVEGHTSNGWGDLTSSKEIYLKNMNLSQERASNVLSFCYLMSNNTTFHKNHKWLEKKLRANGMAFSKLLYKDKKTRLKISRDLEELSLWF